MTLLSVCTANEVYHSKLTCIWYMNIYAYMYVLYVVYVVYVLYVVYACTYTWKYMYTEIGGDSTTPLKCRR